MNEDRIAAERDTIARRVAEFRETQARFQRAREDHFEATIEKVRNIDWNNSFDRTLTA
jgi:hypothetical protein